jgi:hypothetical protein
MKETYVLQNNFLELILRHPAKFFDEFYYVSFTFTLICVGPIFI